MTTQVETVWGVQTGTVENEKVGHATVDASG